MICGICGREFTPRTKKQLYCKKNCSQKSKSSPELRKTARWFAKEWAAWKSDFAAGLTQSNLVIQHER